MYNIKEKTTRESLVKKLQALNVRASEHNEEVIVTIRIDNVIYVSQPDGADNPIIYQNDGGKLICNRPVTSEFEALSEVMFLYNKF